MNALSELQYPRPVDVVMRMFTDRAYFDRKYAALDVTDYQELEYVPGDAFCMRYRFRAAGQTRLPEFARKLVGDSIRVRQTDRWQVPQRVGSIDIEISGAPATVHGVMRLTARGPRACMLGIDWKIDCGIPLIGSKIERVIAEDVLRRAAADGRLSIELLKDYA